MTKKISNINQLREDALTTIERLDGGEIEIEVASAKSKLYDNVMTSLKLEIVYAKLKQELPDIPFLQKGLTIEGTKEPRADKALEKK